jgi:nucleotide-binding universal stress UspA family protein
VTASDADPAAMRWIIDLDLFEPRGIGAAGFAAWVERVSGTPRPRFTMVHVVDARRTWSVDAAQREIIARGARRALGRAVARIGVDPERVVSIVAWYQRAEDALSSMAGTFGADAILLTRRAPPREDPVVRLGRPIRRLLRSLPTTVVVAPPDLAANGVCHGPVLVADDGREDVRSAALVGQRFAASLGRSVDRVCGLSAPHRETEEDVVRRVLRVARERKACLVMCAAPMLSAVDGVFESGIGSHLAAVAPFPVAVVPSR